MLMPFNFKEAWSIIVETTFSRKTFVILINVESKPISLMSIHPLVFLSKGSSAHLHEGGTSALWKNFDYYKVGLFCV
jgi:hypothetical protein